MRLDNGMADSLAVVPGLETVEAQGMIAVYQDQLPSLAIRCSS